MSVPFCAECGVIRKKYGFVAAFLSAVALCGVLFVKAYGKDAARAHSDAATIVASFYPMYIAALNVVGDCEGVSLKSLSEPQTGCLHDFQLTPEDIELLSQADAFVVNGRGMESFLVEAVEDYPQLTVVSASDGIEGIRETPSETSERHDEEGVNAHFWMGLEEYRAQVAAIAVGLGEAVPERKEEFLENAAEYDRKLEELCEGQKELRAAASGRKMISLHEAYAYLAKDYGMEICETVNLDEERQVSAGEVANALSAAREEGARLLLAEERYGRGLAETIQNEADVTVVFLDTLTSGERQKDSYLTGMQENMERLRKALKVE